MPIEIRNRAESADCYWYFIVDAITIAFVVSLMLWKRVSPSQTGLQLANWREGVIVGAAAGVLRLLLMGTLVKLSPWAISGRNGPHHLSTGSIRLWVITFLVGAFSEELWIAFCVVAFLTTGHSEAICVSITAIVFGAVHWEYRFGAFATAMYGAVSALLFLWLGSLIPMFLFHFIGNLGSLYWVRRA